MYKKQFVFLIQIILCLLIVNLSSVSAETIILKSGEQVKGKIIERTDQTIKVKVKYLSFPLTYYLDEIERVEEEVPLSPPDTVSDVSSEHSEIEKYTTEVNQYIKDKKYEDALLLLKKTIELYPNKPGLYIGLSLFYYRLGHFQEAISSVQESLDFQPIDPDAYLCLGIIYDSAGKREEAGHNWLKALELYEQKADYIKAFIAEFLLEKID